EQQRVDAGGIDGVDAVDAGDDRGDNGSGQLVDDLAEAGVLLGRPADHREGPDGPGTVVDGLDVQHGEVVGQAVVAEVVAEGPCGPVPVRIDGADEGGVGLGGDGQRGAAGGDEPDAPAAQGAGEGQLG